MFRFGVDYYPEHWPEDRWATDVRLMQEAGFNTVRLAEFAWSRLEPAPGQFDFAWLDRAIDLLADAGIQVLLGTPTASPPPWVMAMYPDAFLMMADGRRQTYGNRREYCPTHPGYRERSRLVTEAMAAHYAGHSAVIGWQTDNEFGDRCFCPTCRRHFQAWLQDRYGDLDTLNAAWGTIFWSHVYTDWSQIPVPLATVGQGNLGSHNPGLALAYLRFMSHAYVEFQREQVEILRRHCPDHFITHNLMGFHYDKINYFDLSADLDFVSWDNYRRMQWTMEYDVVPSHAALAHAAMRGLKGRNYWVMEQQSGPGGWDLVSVAPRPGELRLWAYQSIAHGADGMIFFRWRTMRHGTEQYWHGLLEHDGRTGRRYQEIKQMGAEMADLGEHIVGAEVRAQVAILHDYDSRFALQVQPNHPELHYTGHVHDIFAALHHRNVAVDLVGPGVDLSGYQLVVAPAMYVLSDETARQLTAFVDAGGTLLVTPRTGVKDSDNTVVEMPLPGLLADLCGVRVTEYDSFKPGTAQPLQLGAELGRTGLAPQARIWADVLELAGAQPVATFTQDYYAGCAAVTEHRYGAGTAFYAATFGDAALYDALADYLLNRAEVQVMGSPADQVEVVVRGQDDKEVRFLLNHADEPRAVTLPHGHHVLLGADHVTTDGADLKAVLPPRGVLVLSANAA